MRIAFIDQSWEGWPTSREYLKAQICSLLAVNDGGVEIVVATGQPEAFGLPDGIDARPVEYVSPPEVSEMSLRDQVLQRTAGRLGLRTDPRVRTFRAWARRHGVDVLLSFFPPTWWRPCGAAVCGWIPDFQHRHLPEFFSSAESTARDEDYLRLSRMADLTVLSSESAKRDFERFCAVYAGKGRVFRFPSLWAFQEHLPPPDMRALERHGIEPGFLLVVNQFFAHKNHIQVVDAMGRLAQEGRCPQVVMIGCPTDPRDMGGKVLSALLGRIAELGIEGRVKLLGFVSAELRDTLMRTCRVLIQPSRFEGWNTSIEDAKALGRPVIASDIPVHREQLSDEGGFFDPMDAGDLAKHMQRACDTLPVVTDFDREAAALAAARERVSQAGQTLLGICREAARET